MSTLTAHRPLRDFLPRPRQLPVLATLGLFVAAWVFGATQYVAFGSPQVVLNIFIDNAFLLVVAVGMTFVILTGGIDLSVGAVVALSTVVSADLLTNQGWAAPTVIVLVLAIGTALGTAMGAVIHFFAIQPFVVTLAGMFLARGLCYTISTEAITVTDPGLTALSSYQVPLGGDLHISVGVLVALAVVAAAGYVLRFTRFGRGVYAVGGSEPSALLMGLAVARTKIAVYAISGFCSALGGVLLTLYTLSGNSTSAVGMELDAIAAVVIGGTVLTGGSGYLTGTVLGVLVLGMIQTLITFDGTLSSWWTRIAIGALLFVFIVLQRLVVRRR